MTELYVTQRLDDSAIGELYGAPAYRVTLRRRELGGSPAGGSTPASAAAGDAGADRPAPLVSR